VLRRNAQNSLLSGLQNKTGHLPLQKRPVDDPAGLTELMVFCEQTAGYVKISAAQTKDFFDALVRMFEQALQSANTLPANGPG